MKNINYKIILAATLGIVMTACIHNQKINDQNQDSQRTPTSISAKIKIMDLNIKTDDPARYIEFDPLQNLAGFENHVQNLLQQSNDEKKSDVKKDKPLSMEQSIRFNAVEKGYRAGLKNILEQINQFKISATSQDKTQAIYKIQLIAKALQNKYIPPIKTSYEATLIPIYILKYTYNQKIDKESASVDSNVNPDNSLLWNPSKVNTKGLNLFSFRLKTIDRTCRYEKAKSGWGVHPGFHIQCGSESYKLKFGNEVSSGPLNSRIYQALGYESPEVNYADSVNVNYDRRMFTEFNLRKTAAFSITVLGQKAFTINQKYTSDLFDSADEFVLTNGQHISAADFKKTLLNANTQGRVIVDADFNSNIESTIDYVSFKNVTITTKSDDTEIGPWKVDDLDFAQKREFRGLMVLSAWLGNFDVRMDNNRLIQKVEKGQDSELKLALVDVGSGLGNSNSIPFKSSSNINQMPWTVTETYKDGSSETEFKDRLQMVGYLTLELNKTFEKVQLSDAQWMLRQMCLLSKTQLTEALMASGLSSAGVKLTEAKLLNRRNKMIEDFEMQSELQLSCYAHVDKKLNYDPTLDGFVTITSAEGKKITAPNKNEIVRNGVLVTR